MYNLLLIFLLICLSVTALMTLYLLVFALAGYFYHSVSYQFIIPSKLRKIAVFIPAYKEDFVIVDSAKRALEQDYPPGNYDVIVIADSLKENTIRQLGQLPIKTVEVKFEVSTKAKALNTTMSVLPTDYDIAVILDADNVMSPDFLTLMNAAFDKGWKAVQGHRLAKNTNNSVAVLDAVSEELNNHILRKGHRALGFSSSIIGSGMAFDYSLFKQTMSNINAISGFDKYLQMSVIKAGHKIEYLEEALCYDEKVQDPQVFENQRTRWIASQFKNIRQDFLSGMQALFKGNIDYFEKAMQTFLLPKVMLLGVEGLWVAVSLLLQSPMLLLLSGIQLVVLGFVFYISTPDYLKSRLTFSEIKQVPNLLLRFVRAMFNRKKAAKRFINTPHTVVVED